MRKMICDKCGKELNDIGSCKVTIKEGFKNMPCKTPFFVMSFDLCDKCYSEMKKWITRK